eukprot:Phypoly_transcript_10569.p1 GENE.Phypoly_transcript_10569~~Phypoly_transcript_10569.p1  ORF type:complete len:399 (+),score=41.16 Phypoly_transcript_10569:52-1248(+)
MQFGNWHRRLCVKEKGHAREKKTKHSFVPSCLPQGMFGYTKVPSTLPQSCINEDTCSLNNGIKVSIKLPGREKNKRGFTAEYVSSTQIWKYVVYLAIFTCIFSVFGGVLVRFYGPHRVNTYLNYSSTNCTIQWWNVTKDSHGNIVFVVHVSYINLQNETKQGTMDRATNYFYDKHWGVGSQFKCVYHENFLEEYSQLESALSSVKNLWFLGFIVPFGSSFIIGGFILLVFICVKKIGQTYYFPHTITYTDDFVINDWAHIPSNLHHLFYATMVAYHAAEGYVGDRSLNFRLPKNDGVRFFKGMLLGGAIFMLACSIGALVFVGWCFWTYLLVMYCVGLYFTTIAVLLFGLALFMFQQFQIDRFEVETTSGFLTKNIMYTVGPNQISGIVTQKPNSSKV